MALHFSSLFGRGEQQINSTTGAAGTAPVSDSGRVDAAGQIRGLRSGQTLNGEVVARNGNDVQIRLDGDTVIHARLERDMNVSVGQNITFEVRTFGQSEGTGGIALRPLFENMAQDASAVKALTAASVPITGDTAAMVAVLMKEGMSIDMSSLQGMYRDMTAFPEADLQDMAALHKLGLPVNDENLRQMSGYRNLEHQIISSVDMLADQAAEMLLGLVDTNPGQAGRLLFDLLHIFAESVTDSAEAELPASETAPGEGQEVSQSAVSVEDMPIPENGQEVSKSAASVEELPAAEAGKEEPEQAVLMKELPENETEQNAVPRQTGTVLADLLPEDGAREEFAAALGKAGLSEPLAEAVSGGTMPVRDLALEIQELLSKGAVSKRALRELLGNGGMKALLSNRMEENLLLRAERGFTREDVSRLYGRLLDETARLTQALSRAGAEEGTMAKSVQQIRESVDFLNQLNQTCTYVQLPLKLAGQKAHGDLYVYTNKKNLAKKDGTVSALLHLDMEHLGSLDVYVAMTREKVNTRFYLEREELLDFLEQNIHILNERLNRKGYHMNCEVLLHDRPAQVMEEILKQEGKASVLSQYSFDVRA